MKRRRLSALAADFGCAKDGLDPVPPDQYLWMQGPSEPPLYRLWSWMIYHCLHWGHDSAYAVSIDQHELHLKHAAADLKMDEGNIYKYWNMGVARGLWRDGTAEEGPQRMYLNGKVAAQKGEDTAKEIVCTYNFPKHMLTLPKALLEKIQQLSDEDKRDTFIRYGRIVEAGKMGHAELLAAHRMMLDQFEDTLWREKGIAEARNRQEHKRKDATAEEIQARQQRIAGVLPEVEKFVHTILLYVQHQEEADPSVYEALYTTPFTTPSLLVLNEPEEPDAGMQAGSVNGAAPEPVKPLPTKARGSYTRPKSERAPAAQAPPEPEVKPRKLDTDTQAALRTLAEEIESMQKAYPLSDFGRAEFDPISKPGQVFLLNVLDTIGGPDQVLPFCLFVAGKLKGTDGFERHAMGKQPARTPGTTKGPRGMGLLLEWAGDFGRRARGASASDVR